MKTLAKMFVALVMYGFAMPFPYVTIYWLLVTDTTNHPEIFVIKALGYLVAMCAVMAGGHKLIDKIEAWRDDDKSS